MCAMRFGLLVVLVLAAACYEPPVSNSCTITCTEGVAGNCPGDLVCESGYCVGDGQVCRPTFVQIAAGTGTACAIDDQGALWCWGKLPGTSIATRIDATRHWDSIDGGGGQMCGIADSALYCWGENNDREVSGTVVGDVAEPLLIEAVGITRWVAVSAGSDYTCAVGDGQLVCWGSNFYGQLGDGTSIDRAIPTPVAANITDWIAVAAGDFHTCAVSSAFGVHCFGRDVRGELGVNGVGGSPMPVAVTVLGNPLFAVDIAVASQSSCAITPEQQVYCWGLNASGQLGDKRLVDPNNVPMTAEPQLASDVAGFTKIEGARVHYCGLAADAVYCWGEALAGGLGNGIWADTRVFSKVIAAGAVDISVGNARNEITAVNDLDLGCAIVGADAQCWGDNRYGQLGQGTATLALTPTEVAGDLRFTDVSAGSQHMCGIGDDATLYCWGSTERGQATGFVYGLANPRTPCAMNPTDPTQPLCDVGTPRALSYAPNPTHVTTGNTHSCALANGVTSCWGLGLPGGTAIKRDLAQPGGAMWKSLLHTGRDGQCGVADAVMSPMYCIGNVIGSTNNPVRVPQLDGFTALALGGNPAYGAFLDATGLRHGYGDNGKYQLGDGTTTGYGALMPIGTQTYSAISTRANDSQRGDANFTCAIRSTDQKIECWGEASRGQTGATDPTMPSMIPNEVPNLSNCTSVATGVEHACAICDGNVSCWGDNRSGQLAMPQSMPVNTVPRVIDIPLTGDPWVQVVAGSRFTCARSTAGRLFCWGLSEHGALGTGATGSNLPMTVLASQID